MPVIILNMAVNPTSTTMATLHKQVHVHGRDAVDDIADSVSSINGSALMISLVDKLLVNDLFFQALYAKLDIHNAITKPTVP